MLPLLSGSSVGFCGAVACSLPSLKVRFSLLCLLYCLIAPNQYEAAGRVELRTAPVSSLNLEAQ